ncbi:choice-of-anchor A family protein [Hyalangium minutum]|nr:choice-of-anchor A family protein [Hyalangium minutum]
MRSFLRTGWLLTTLAAFGCGREAAVPTPSAAPAAPSTSSQQMRSGDKVLILGSSVSGGLESREAQAVAAASPFTQIDVVTPEQWRAMTAHQFMDYRALIIGDGACQSGEAAFQAAIDTRDRWGIIVDGDVAILSTDPVTNGTPQLVENAISHVLNSQQYRTGMYIALGCAYENAQAPTQVKLLEPFGTFTVQGMASCPSSGHIFEMYNNLVSQNLMDGQLSGDNGCVARSVFTGYPKRNFSYAAIALSSSDGPIPGEQVMSDFLMDPGTETFLTGTPYLLVRGAMTLGAGCGLSEAPSSEECDMGDWLNGTPAQTGTLASSTCSFSCHMNWCGDGHVDTEFGEECDEGIHNGRSGDTEGRVGTCTSFCKRSQQTPPPTLPRPPVARCQDVTVVAEYTCGVTAVVDQGSSDPDGDMAGCTQSPTGPYDIGETEVYLTCTDREGLQSSCKAVVTVLDRVKPQVELNGLAVETLECTKGATYTDPGAPASDLCEGPLYGDQISRTGSVNLEVPSANYTLTYVATDSAGNTSEPATRTVAVADTLAPAITLHGLINQQLECGTAYTESGASASDRCAGNLSASITRSGTVNPQVPGAYVLRYNVSDPSHHAAPEASRVITVADTLSPTVTINGVLNAQVECGSGAYVDPGASASDACAGSLATQTLGSVNTAQLGTYTLSYKAVDPSGNTGTAAASRSVTVRDTLAPQIQVRAGATTVACNGSPYVDPGATASDQCAGNLTQTITTTSNLDQTRAGQYTVTYRVADAAGNVGTAVRPLTVGPCSTCTQIRLSDYNLFLLEDYTQGVDVQGKVAAGGNISMTNFAVGGSLAASDISNVLVAGGNLTLANGRVYGNTFYGNNYSANQGVTIARGSLAKGTPIDFAAKFAELRTLSTNLANQTANGTTTRESWGGIFLRGTSTTTNIFNVNASAFNGAALLNINVPAGSMVIINIRGASATLRNFGYQLSSGIDARNILYNFVDTTSITSSSFGIRGTVLAPYARINFSNGNWDGGIYAVSLTGNAEGHVFPLYDRDVCP